MNKTELGKEEGHRSLGSTQVLYYQSVSLWICNSEVSQAKLKVREGSFLRKDPKEWFEEVRLKLKEVDVESWVYLSPYTTIKLQ